MKATAFLRISNFFRLFYNIQNALSLIVKAHILKTKEITAIDRKTGVRLLFKRDALQVYNEVWYNQDYDIPEVQIRKNDVVIDIGANAGFYSCYAGSLGAKVYAFEPEADNFSILRKNIDANKLTSTVIPFQLAIGGKKGKATLFRINKLGGAMHTTQTAFANAYSNIETFLDNQIVEQITIDDFLQENNIKNIRCIKLDCEGSEFEILRSIPKKTYNNIDSIVFEYHATYSLSEVFQFIKELDCFHISIVNNLPWARREIVKLVNHRVLDNISSFGYGI